MNPIAGPAPVAAPVAPPSAFRKLAPGLLGIAMASSPMGVFGGMARLAAASLGNANNPRGLGFNQSTLDANNAFSPARSDMIGNSKASYGRKTSDGVRGTTSGGTNYTSRNGGRDIDIGGRSYTSRGRGKYSLNVGRR
jgi:hypothetical protein